MLDVWSVRRGAPWRAGCVVVLALAMLVACGDDSGGNSSSGGDTPDASEDASDNAQGADAALDTSEDAAPDTPDDVEGDVADAALDAADGGGDVDEQGVVEITEATGRGGGARVEVRFAPEFALEVHRDEGDGSGELLVRARGAGDEVRFDGIAVGVAEPLREDWYYEPTLQLEWPGRDTVTWYQLDTLQSSQAAEDGGGRFTVRTRSADGAPGPWVTLEVGSNATDATVRLATDDTRVVYLSLNLEARPDEGFFGLGELFDRVDARGSVRDMQIQATGESESGTNEVHVPVTFTWTTAGYGVFLDSRAPSAFDLASTVDDGMRSTVHAREAQWRFITGPTPDRLIERYTDIVGKPAHVPFWALAPQFWRNVNRDDLEVIEDAQRARDFDIPTSVLWIDRPWSSYYHDWRFNPSQFPDPEAMFATLHGLGYRVMLHHSPQLNPPGQSDLGENENADDGLYARYLDNDWLVLTEDGSPFLFPWGGGTGAFIDFSHPDAQADVQALLRRVTDLGAVGTKMDWDEFLQPNVTFLRIPLTFHNGETNLTMKTWYSALYHKTIIEGFDAGLGEPSFHVSRSGMARDQVWNTCIWPGDLDNDFSEHGFIETQEQMNVGGLPAAIVANQTLGLSGYPCFASDIGGYRGGDPDEETLIRWIEFGIFNTVTQIGGGGDTHMPWSADTPYSEAALEAVRRYFKLRMTLVPYIHHHLLDASATGRPFVKSLYAAYSDDPETRNYERTFMFGPDILVAPVYEEGVVVRETYLPEGDWVDFWDGTRYPGPGWVSRAAPVGTIPLYVRAGAIVPMGWDDIDTLLPVEDDPEDAIVTYQERRWMRVHVVPGSEARTLDVFNGLGVDLGAVSAEAVEIGVRLGAPRAGLDPRVAFAPEGVELIVEADQLPFDDGPSAVRLTRGDQVEALEEGDATCDACWRWDAERGQVRVRVAGEGVVTIE